MEPPATDEVLIRREGRAGRITMNRPKALNALTYAMVGRIWDALVAWRDDPTVELVLLDGAGDRALCAGGDVRSLYDSRTQGSGFARTFWRDEYRLNALIGRYPKPYVAIQDGIVMGGGIGLSGHAAPPHRHGALPPRHAGDGHRSHPRCRRHMAAGACAGAGWRLPGPYRREHERCRCHSRAFLATRSCPPASSATSPPSSATRKAAMSATLSPGTPRNRDPHRWPATAPTSTGPSPAIQSKSMLAALAEMPGEWAAKTAAALSQKSPKALKLTLAAIRNARSLASLDKALIVEYRLTVRLFEDGEFPEGVRALIVDKDRKPRWSPPQLDGVTTEMVARYLTPFHPVKSLTFEDHSR